MTRASIKVLSWCTTTTAAATGFSITTAESAASLTTGTELALWTLGVNGAALVILTTILVIAAWCGSTWFIVAFLHLFLRFDLLLHRLLLLDRFLWLWREFGLFGCFVQLLELLEWIDIFIVTLDIVLLVAVEAVVHVDRVLVLDARHFVFTLLDNRNRTQKWDESPC